MKRIKYVLFLAGMVLFISCSHYTAKFTEKYLDYKSDLGGTAIIVYPKDDGFCFVHNDEIRQIFYPKFGTDYPDYQSFLLNLLNGKVDVKFDGQTRITRFDKASSAKKTALIEEYLSQSLTEGGLKVYEFKKRSNLEDELGLVKMMFDLGYYVHWNDHAAEYAFVESGEN